MRVFRLSTRYVAVVGGAFGLLGACGGDEFAGPMGPLSSEAQSIVNHPMEGSLFATVTLMPGTPLLDSEGHSLGVFACPPGEARCEVQVQRIERVTSRGERLYWLRAAGTEGEARSGQIAGGRILGAEPTVDVSLANGNGGAVALSGRTGEVVPQPISIELGFPGRSPAQRDQCFSYRPYGTPGDIVTRPPNDPSYTMLVWSLPNVRGGGLNRRVIRRDAPIWLTTEPDVTLDTYPNSERGACGTPRNGRVTWMYVMTRQNGQDIYGWMVKESQRGDGLPRAHWRETTRRTNPPPDAQPTPPRDAPTMNVPRPQDCFARCCDTVLTNTRLTGGEGACRAWAASACAARHGVRRAELDGREVADLACGCFLRCCNNELLRYEDRSREECLSHRDVCARRGGTRRVEYGGVLIASGQCR